MIYLEQLLNARKPKYTVLNGLFEEHQLNFGRLETVRVFLDIDCFINALFDDRIDNLDEQLATKPVAIASEILNTIGFIRHYFFSRQQVSTDIFFYRSTKEAVLQTDINPKYKQSFYNKRSMIEPTKLSEHLQQILTIVRRVSAYIPHAHVLNTGSLDANGIPVLLKDMMSDEYLDIPHHDIVISNEPSMISVVNEGTSLLTFRGARSELFRPKNAWRGVQRLFSVKKPKEDIKLGLGMIPVAIAMSGFAKYGLDGIPSFRILKSINFLSKEMDAGNITGKETDIETVLDGIQTKELSDETKQRCIDNFTLLTPNEIHKRYATTDSIKVFSQIRNKEDQQGLFELNEKYFRQSPLFVDYLLEGEG